MKHSLTAVVLSVLAASAAKAAPSCKSISVTPLAFGAYDVYSGVATDSAGTITYSCPPPTTPTVTIDAGLAFGNGSRRMTLSTGGDWLAYEIYADAARTVVWAATPIAVAAGNGATVSYYARAFAQQDVSVGSYTDTLIVTFNF